MERSGRRAGVRLPLPSEEGRREEIIPLPEGVDGESGLPVRSPGMDEVLRLLLAQPLGRGRGTKREVIDGVNPQDLAQAGWGVIFPESAGDAEGLLRELDPLLKHRQKQSGGLYRDFLGRRGYRHGDDSLEFLKRHGAGPGRVDPKLMPYYLLIVGSPEQIPYEFQYGLDLHHAVGRIHFENSGDYARYAECVEQREKAALLPSRKVALFGPRRDKESILSADALLAPLAERLREKCELRQFLGESATKPNLKRLVGGDATPNILFTAGHGLVFRAESPRQRCRQGALVCQEWPGWDYGPPAPDHVFAGDDVEAGAQLQGLIAFLFACHSAGTPMFDDFVHEGTPATVTFEPFVSRLAQQLLGSGALAVVGHVERAWKCSFLWRDSVSQVQTFAEAVQRLLNGGPLGWALEPINQRYADLAASLNSLLSASRFGRVVDKKSLDDRWTETQDARNYVIVGDPAVRLFTPSQPQKKQKVYRDGSGVQA